MELLTKNTTANNPVLKIVTAILFITFPILGFAFGMQYQKLINPSIIQYITKEKVIKVPFEETPRDLIDRCGMTPKEDLNIKKGHFTMVDGPIWSPDCRHIAWSLWESGAMGMEYKGPYPQEGLYIYNDKTKQIKKIFTLKSPEENPEFKKWKDSNTIIFKQGGQKQYQYNLKTQLINEIK